MSVSFAVVGPTGGVADNDESPTFFVSTFTIAGAVMLSGPLVADTVADFISVGEELTSSLVAKPFP